MAIRGLPDAEESFVAGRFDEVMEICGELIVQDPECHQAFYLLGRTCMTLGNLKEAREMITQATCIRADAAPYHTELGHLLAAEGQLNAAVDAYRTAVELSPDFIDPLVNLGAALQLLGCTEEAVAVYEAAVKLAPDAALLHFNLAEMQSELGSASCAADGYRRAVELEPEWSELQRKFGLSLLATGEPEAAQEACRKAVSLKPDDAENHVALSRSLVAAGDLRGALTICDAYLTSQAFNVAVEACRAFVLIEMGSRDAGAYLLGLDAFIKRVELSAPVDFGSLSAFNDALEVEANRRCKPSLPRLVGNRQLGGLFREPLATVALLKERIEELVCDYIKELSEADDHPFVLRQPGTWHLSVYAIELDKNGSLDAHIRSGSWLGGLYIAKVDQPLTVKIGVPPRGWEFSAEPIARVISLEPGELLFFPGHVYCSVTPECGGGCLLYGVQILGSRGHE